MINLYQTVVIGCQVSFIELTQLAYHLNFVVRNARPQNFIQQRQFLGFGSLTAQWCSKK
jgi:hypothetical protein